MTVKDPEIYKMIEKIGEYYRSNINNRYLRPALLRLELSSSDWEHIDNLTSETEYKLIREYSFVELYERILALARFVSLVKKEVLPNLRTYSGSLKTSAMNEREKVLFNIAFSNLPSNLGVLSDLLNELYLKTIELDKSMHPSQKPDFERISELKEIGSMLV
ncbi:MAG: hypothetical protein DRP87_04835 [Spirochaetes bacterium]|nr:MAG: hypothetical protein DRP87_04835 [Spirochaetota bacterium]